MLGSLSRIAFPQMQHARHDHLMDLSREQR